MKTATPAILQELLELSDHVEDVLHAHGPIAALAAIARAVDSVRERHPEVCCDRNKGGFCITFELLRMTGLLLHGVASVVEAEYRAWTALRDMTAKAGGKAL